MIRIEFKQVAKYAYEVIGKDSHGNYVKLGIMQKISNHWYLIDALAQGRVVIQRYGDSYDEAKEWIKLDAHLQITDENLHYIDPLVLFDERKMKVYTPEMIQLMREGKHFETN